MIKGRPESNSLTICHSNAVPSEKQCSSNGWILWQDERCSIADVSVTDAPMQSLWSKYQKTVSFDFASAGFSLINLESFAFLRIMKRR